MTPIRIEAETMNLSGYDIESQSFASGGSLIRIPNDGDIGTASIDFTGASGTYEVVIGYHDENDGESPMTVSIGGNTLDSWTFDQQLGTSRANAENFVLRTLSTGVTVNTGDAIELEGILNVGEVARVDYLEFIPVEEPTPDTTVPTASASVTDFAPTSGSSDTYSFTVTYTDNEVIDETTLDGSDVRVTGSNGFDEFANFISAATNNGQTTVTYEIEAPEGGWQEGNDGTYSIAVEANQVSDTSGNSVASGVLDTFELDVASPPSESTQSIRIEAETMNLSGFRVESQTRAFASQGSLIRLRNNSDTGTASIDFTGASGTYEVIIGYHDESDGESEMSVSIGGNTLDSWTLDQQLGPKAPQRKNFVLRTLSTGVTVNTGDTIEIEATLDAGEMARVDYLQFVPVEDTPDTTAPTASASVADFAPTSGSSDSYSFDITYTDNVGLNNTTFDNRDVRVTGSNGFKERAKFVGAATSNGQTTVTYELEAPEGGWQDGDDGTYSIAVRNNQVRDISGNSVASGVLGTFDVDVASPPPESGNSIRIEAETMNLSGYDIESQSFASGGSLIRIPNDGDIGTAAINFTGTSGTYEVLIGYHDENDGNSPMSVSIGGNTLDSWTFDQQLGTSRASAENFVLRTLSTGVTVNTGDAIELEGILNVGEVARVDYLEFIPVEEESAPTASFSYAQAGKGVLVNLEEGTGFISNYDTPIRIMPLGDSITQGKIDNNIPEAQREGYRGFLWNHFQELGLAIDFVGSESNGTSNLPDKDHEGHSGWTINQLRDGRGSVANSGVDNWIPAAEPDVVLLAAGTNDASAPGATIASRLSGLIDKIVAQPEFDGELLVSTIPPIHEESIYFEDRMPNVLDYNSRISGVVQSKPESANVSFVDTVSGPNGLTGNDISAPPDDNGLHPTAGGYEKIAQFWYDAVLEQTGDRTDLSNVDDAIGSGYDDMIAGNANANLLEGGAGNDTITGGGGADRFAYSAPTEGSDLLTDFDPNEGDTIEISASGFGSGLVAGVALSLTDTVTGVFASGVAPAALSASAHFLYDTATGVLRFDGDGTGALEATEIATLAGAPTLSANDLSIV